MQDFRSPMRRQGAHLRMKLVGQFLQVPNHAHAGRDSASFASLSNGEDWSLGLRQVTTESNRQSMVE